MQPDFHDNFMGLSEMVFVDTSPRIMSMDEIREYLANDDADKDPLWVQWASDSVKGGWVLAHTVADLVWRYEAIFGSSWVLWTKKPSEEQREAVEWQC